VPRLAADRGFEALSEAFTAGELPCRGAAGAPSRGLALRTTSDGSIEVLGARSPLRFGRGSAPRMIALLRGEASATAAEADILHALGLWDSQDTLTGANGAPTEAVAAFLSRRVATTRWHRGADEAWATWTATRLSVLGITPLAQVVRAAVQWDWPASGSMDDCAVVSRLGPRIHLVVDQTVDPDSEVPQLPVMLSPNGLVIGPWCETGELPCPTCVGTWTAGRNSSSFGASSSILRWAAGIVALEVVNTITGIGRSARPGIAVAYNLEDYATSVQVVVPAQSCVTCLGEPAAMNTAVRTDDLVLADVAALLRTSAPTRRWTPPSTHEVHFQPEALQAQHAAAGGLEWHDDGDSSRRLLLSHVLAATDDNGVITRAAASAGNLGAGTLLAGKDGQLSALRVRPGDHSQTITASLVDGTSCPRPQDLVVGAELGRLTPKYGDDVAELAWAEAGALLGHTAVAATSLGLRIESVDAIDAIPSDSSTEWVLGTTFTLRSGNSAPRPSSDGWHRRRSTRAVRWVDADLNIVTMALRRARRIGRHLGLDFAPLRWDLLRGHNIDDLVMQPGLDEDGALLVAHVDLRCIDDTHRARHDAAAILTIVALTSGNHGLDGSLIHGLVPVAVAQALDGGLAATYPLMGWLCGRARVGD
jgi:hypothetical protein